MPNTSLENLNFKSSVENDDLGISILRRIKEYLKNPHDGCCCRSFLEDLVSNEK